MKIIYFKKIKILIILDLQLLSQLKTGHCIVAVTEYLEKFSVRVNEREVINLWGRKVRK